MKTFGISELQSKPSLTKTIEVGKIVDRRKQVTLGYFVSARYRNLIEPILKKIEKEEKRAKLRRLKAHQDLSFSELGIDDGI